jgi:ABC-type transport system involved in cytochrome bd biosynthesis fused ATPase/permease subunit
MWRWGFRRRASIILSFGKHSSGLNSPPSNKSRGRESIPWLGRKVLTFFGGQRQRLGMARAFYSRPKLLVLDEATSALDAETERIITETLDSLAGDVTLIVSAHRLATVRHCDQVIHLSWGRVNDRGNV